MIERKSILVMFLIFLRGNTVLPVKKLSVYFRNLSVNEFAMTRGRVLVELKMDCNIFELIGMFVLISYLESKAMHVCVCIRDLERMTYVRTCVRASS